MEDIEFGEPKILPRVGDEYQAELPQLAGVADDEIRGDDSLQNLTLGSPLKLTRISNNCSVLVEGECSVLVPGICDEQWSAVEKECFLLGLYIFAKNFVELQKFVETKDMGALQSYYYGNFYSSPQHLRWSNIQRVKNKRAALRRRGIFSGAMLKELLSRLLPRVEQSQIPLLEVCKSYEDREISIAKCVGSLKAIVGAEILVEAVGMGRGDEDLTAMALGHSNKSNKKLFSSLATPEVVNILSGLHRLSKARSSDLFWEAVWPRLLANGWHSEERTTYTYTYTYTAASTPSLVFLVPGVNKFSRRKLVRGCHYFESPSDVLSKVGRQPGLLEEVGCSNGAEGDGKCKENEKRKMDLEEAGDHRAPTTKRTRVLSSSGGEEETQERPPTDELVIDLNLAPSEGEQSNPSSRRYSTRHRPPTARVLDCFAHGYLIGNRSHKRKED